MTDNKKSKMHEAFILSENDCPYDKPFGIIVHFTIL